MALELQSRLCEGCDVINFVDTTGAYSVDNPTGYGVQNGVTDPADFDTYILEIWFPESDRNGPADYTLDLLTVVPQPDADNHYTWLITQTMLGVSPIVSGIYYARATGVKAGLTYISDAEKIFLGDLRSKVDAAMNDFDPTCPCKKGCTDRAKMYAEFLALCNGVCDPKKTTALISALYSKTKNCC